jgi:hypothetical protein
MWEELDMIDIVIRVTNEQRQRIEERAHQHGFETLSDYLLSLVEEDAPTKEELLTRFRNGWAAAMNEDTIPASKLREFLDSEE